jgi:two-component system sensor histidine kinase HydH
MQPTASELRRRARHHVLRSPPTEMAQGQARIGHSLVIVLQIATMLLLGLHGFPVARLAAHAVICLFYVGACRSSGFPISERSKMRLLFCSLLSFGAWSVNTGGLQSPLLPMGLGIVLPALLVFDTGRLRVFFAGGATLVLLGVAALSTLPVGRLVAPLVPVDGRPSIDYLVIVTSSLVVTVVNVSGLWGLVTAAYAKVAVELGHRREELCSMGEDRMRELEGAAANLAHEMKNPLASIKALSAHMARCPTLDPRTVRRLEVVSTEADRLESIVDSFLSLSRGLGELHLGQVRPHALAVELKLLLDERAAEAGVTIEVTGRPEIEVLADAGKLQRALFYLTMNAVQASASGQAVTIDVASTTAPGSLVIRIVDHGLGMCHATLERLQRPPFSTRKGGSGLGVAVARALINQHGGQLRYESVPRHGTTVIIELPPRPPAGAEPPKAFTSMTTDAAVPG